MTNTQQPELAAGMKSKVRYGMLALVFVNVVINYLDRSNLSVAAAGLGSELKLSSQQLGLIFSAFGWSYAALQIPGGLLADRIKPRILYAACLITWSLATVAQGFAKGFVSLFGFRLATGAFEAPSYPINNRIVTSWFPDHERASAIALFVSGQFIGLAFLTPVLVALQVHAGWRGLFIVTGLIGFVWELYGIYFTVIHLIIRQSIKRNWTTSKRVEGFLRRKSPRKFLPGGKKIGSKCLVI
jgi:MFS transporter, ACS family, D-galactonate transporter